MINFAEEQLGSRRKAVAIKAEKFLRRHSSGASAFVLGAPTNGNIERKTGDGKTLKEIEASEAFDV